MARSAVMLLVVAMVLLYSCQANKTLAIQKKCDNPNQVYKECGSACPPKCETRNASIACIASCVAGCQCKPDLYLNKNGSCVPASEC